MANEAVFTRSNVPRERRVARAPVQTVVLDSAEEEVWTEVSSDADADGSNHAWEAEAAEPGTEWDLEGASGEDEDWPEFELDEGAEAAAEHEEEGDDWVNGGEVDHGGSREWEEDDPGPATEAQEDPGETGQSELASEGFVGEDGDEVLGLGADDLDELNGEDAEPWVLGDENDEQGEETFGDFDKNGQAHEDADGYLGWLDEANDGALNGDQLQDDELEVEVEDEEAIKAAEEAIFSGELLTEDDDLDLLAEPETDQVNEGELAEEVEEAQEAEDEAGAEETVSERLQDAVHGSDRLKRLLEADIGGSRKRARTVKDQRPSESLLVNQLLRRWGLVEDAASKYVLGTFSMAQLKAIAEARFSPQKTSTLKSPADQINVYAIQLTESKCPSKGVFGPVQAFAFRHQLTEEQQKTLTELNHKDLRHVIENFSKNRDLEEVIDEARFCMAPEGEAYTVEEAAPAAPGPLTLGRIVRLELIDPFADALVVGDANLSFSLQLAQHRKALNHSGRLIATTFETLETLRERYMEIDTTIKGLQDLSVEVMHGVDCTKLSEDQRFQQMKQSFGAVYYNFPHAGAVRGFFDSHPFVRWRHENLMQLFFRCLRQFVKPGGTVKVASNSGATGVRFSDIINAGTLNEFLHIETIPFKEWNLRRYHRSFGDRRDAKQRPEMRGYRSQNADLDMVYTFKYAPDGAGIPEVTKILRLPPSIQDLLETTIVCGCGYITQRMAGPKPKYLEYHFKTSGLHREEVGESKKKFIEDLYRRFVEELSGRHVG